MNNRFRSWICSLPFLASLGAFSQETPFTPYRDGYATSTALVGNSRTLKIRDAESKAWVSHPIGDGAETGVLKARLQVYVNNVSKSGTLKVYLCKPWEKLEGAT